MPATDEFAAWAGRVRAAVETVDRLADAARRKEALVRRLLRRPAPDAAAIGALVIELHACRIEIDRLRRTALLAPSGGHRLTPAI
jgi:hypothetical protein